MEHALWIWLCPCYYGDSVADQGNRLGWSKECNRPEGLERVTVTRDNNRTRKADGREVGTKKEKKQRADSRRGTGLVLIRTWMSRGAVASAAKFTVKGKSNVARERHRLVECHTADEAAQTLFAAHRSLMEQGSGASRAAGCAEASCGRERRHGRRCQCSKRRGGGSLIAPAHMAGGERRGWRGLASRGRR